MLVSKFIKSYILIEGAIEAVNVVIRYDWHMVTVTHESFCV